MDGRDTSKRQLQEEDVKVTLSTETRLLTTIFDLHLQTLKPPIFETFLLFYSQVSSRVVGVDVALLMVTMTMN